MTVPKLRAAILVFVVGFALGLSVFAASRLFVRFVLGADARAAAEELANRLAGDEAVQSTGALSSVVRYTYFDQAGKVVRTAAPGAETGRVSAADAALVRRAAELAAEGTTVVAHSPLLPSLFGLSEPAVKGVAAPVLAGGRTLGTVYVEVDQTLAQQSLSRAFAVIGIVTVGLAVLAVVAVAFAVTRGQGIAPRRRWLDANALPRDPLTGLPTRQGFAAALADKIQRAVEIDAQVGLLVVDFDEFRSLNDIWGHGIADEVLKTAADRLRGLAEGTAALARISGDTFALIVEREANSHSLRQLADRIRTVLGQPYAVAGSSIALGASIGAALFPVNAENAEVLFRAADTALSKAKSEGRSSLAFFDTEMERRMQRRAALERDLRQALDREEFVVFYQPQLELASGRLRGYEALVRWERPGEGILTPGEFLPVAEETGLIRPLGEWVLRKACRDAASWLDSGTVAVNFSAAQFRSQRLDATIAEVLADTGLPAERLEIEVPESLFLDHVPDLMETLTRIKALGVRVAMDDFGSGYSGLASLAHFPFDKIKIDRSFVGQLTEDADVAAIVAAVVGLGRSLSVDITAEGVETSEQVTLLKAAGCSIVQGFLFGAPQRETSASSQPATEKPEPGTAMGAAPVTRAG
jgi:diguanylate cyclase (GGDEF)-like protein